MEADLRQSLKQAEVWLSSGELWRAYELLDQLSRNYRQYGLVWWMLAAASSEREQKRKALTRILRQDTIHATDPPYTLEGVRLLLAQLLLDVPAPKRLPNRKGRQSVPFFLGIVAVVLSVALVFSFLYLSPLQTKDSADVSDVSLEMHAQVAAAVVTPTPYPVTQELLPTPLPNLVLNTPIEVGATVNPTSFLVAALPEERTMNVYWTLNDLSFRSPTTLRFYKTPIKVFLDSQAAHWRDAVENAVREISQVIQMEIVDVSSDADIIVSIIDDTSSPNWSGCVSEPTLLGCGRIIAMRNIVDGVDVYKHVGRVAISSVAPNPRGILLHELLHALGIEGHSHDPNDIMYAYDIGVTEMTQRDQDTLRQLYSTR